MPLLDHFRGEIELELPWTTLPWPTLAQAWAVALMSWLNKRLPRDDFQALTNIRQGAQVEADVVEYRRDEIPPMDHGVNGSVATLTSAPPALLTIQASFPDDIEVEVRERRSGRPVVGVIELISPGNKKEQDERDAFVAKCVAYLKRGIGLVLIDIVTDRHTNLHNELLKALAGPDPQLMADSFTYISGYRPVHRRENSSNELEIWPYIAALGQPLPPVPFGLRGGPVLVLDLEETYTEAIHAGGL